MELRTPITDRADEWCEKVLSGEVLACKSIIKACKRYRADCKRSATDSFPFIFDRERAEHMAGFAEAMPHIEGKWASNHETLKLMGWQAFAICQIAGWVHMVSGNRRFRTAYLEVPRKNGKSTMLAPIGLYYLTVDGEPGAKVYSAASSAAQARIVFECARVMAKTGDVDGMPLSAYLELTVEEHKIKTSDPAAVFQPIASQTKSKDGKNPHCALIDELHEHEKRDVWDSMASALGAREQPLLIAITTAGWNVSGVCFEQRKYLLKLLDGVLSDESYFGMIFEADEGDDPGDPEVWKKANPSLGEAKSMQYMQDEWAKAQASPAALGEFLRKHLNIWTSIGAAALNSGAWSETANPNMHLADYAHLPAYVGVDLAIMDDVASVVVQIPDGELIRVWSWHFLPEKAVHAPGNEHLFGWEKHGYLHTTPGAQLDLNIVQELVMSLAGEGSETWGWAELPDLDLQMVIYDPMFAAQMSANWEGAGITAVELRPRASNLNVPFQRLIGAVEDRSVIHNDNPVMNWMVSNTLLRKVQGGDFIYPAKLSPEDKIDGVAALINAMWPLSAVHVEQRQPDYQMMII